MYSFSRKSTVTLKHKNSDSAHFPRLRTTPFHLFLRSISESVMIRCLKDPLCKWSWFDDECQCHANPCQTLHCYPDADLSDNQCLCSMLMCQWNDSAAACAIEVEGDEIQCRCHTQFVYPLANMPTEEICNQERCEGPHSES